MMSQAFLVLRPTVATVVAFLSAPRAGMSLPATSHTQATRTIFMVNPPILPVAHLTQPFPNRLPEIEVPLR